MSDREHYLIGRSPKTYKEAQDLYERAVAILGELRGGRVLHCEAAALYHGFHDFKEGVDINMAPEWALVAKAGQAALEGMGVKQGSIRPCAPPFDGAFDEAEKVD